MAHVGDEKVGTSREYELRDDDRPSESPYKGGRRSSFGAVLLLGLIMIGAFLAYVAFDRPAGGLGFMGAPAGTARP